MRLLAWCQAVGLSEVESGRPSPDWRLNNQQPHTVVLRLFGFIHSIFENSKRLRDRYGLVQERLQESQPTYDIGEPNQSHLILPLILGRPMQVYDIQQEIIKGKAH